jgi:hypothetical protein
MSLFTKAAAALFVTGVAALTSANLRAQTALAGNASPHAGAVTPASGTGQLTGKERLGEKWKDDQRTDNCKVSLDKRGTKQRPDSCAHTPQR